MVVVVVVFYKASLLHEPMKGDDTPKNVLSCFRFFQKVPFYVLFPFGCNCVAVVTHKKIRRYAKLLFMYL